MHKKHRQWDASMKAAFSAVITIITRKSEMVNALIYAMKRVAFSLPIS